MDAQPLSEQCPLIALRNLRHSILRYHFNIRLPCTIRRRRRLGNFWFSFWTMGRSTSHLVPNEAVLSMKDCLLRRGISNFTLSLAEVSNVGKSCNLLSKNRSPAFAVIN